MNFYVVPFKVDPSDIINLCQRFFPILEALLICTLWSVIKLSQRFSFYLLNRGKTPSFHGSLQSWEQEKVTEG